MEKLPPLFWPVYLKEGIVYMLDETILPQKLHYLELKDYKEVVKAIKDMKTRAFGQVLAVMYTLKMVVLENSQRSNEEILSMIKRVSFELENSRPTFPFKDLTKMVIFWSYEAIERKHSIADFTIKMIEGFLAGIKNARIKRAESLVALLKDKTTVLTHCNVSGELVLMAEYARKVRKEVKFICTETRPYLQGARLTSWELKEAGFEVTLIADNAVGNVISKSMVDVVIVGSDRLAQNGDFANKIGTYPIAVLAKEYNVPFYVLTQRPSSNPTGDSIPIEERDEKEVLEFHGHRIAPVGVSAYYPGFDITRKELITKGVLL